MSARKSDFRSDTVTRPTPAMLTAMVSAELGDDVLDGDPTVQRLERAAAEWTGKEAALFLPSGTMANQVSIGAWTSPGDELVAERSAHLLQWEAGAMAALHGVQAQSLRAPDGRIDPGELASVMRPHSIHCPRNTLLCLEQTFMGDGSGPGGRVVSVDHTTRLAERAHELGMKVHMDGARLANAVVASGRSAAELARGADSVMFSLSKGLGAPVGALAAGPRAFVERARLVRKRLGGWMRQAGVLAGAGLYALEHHLAPLAEDHALARRLAEVLQATGAFEAWPDRVESNIVMARVSRPGWTPEGVMGKLAEHDVLVLPMSADTLRFVTHRDVGPSDVERLERALEHLAA
jgi:threonine aldolase